MIIRPVFAELVEEAEKRGCPLSEIILEREEREHAVPRRELWDKMRDYWQTMSQAVMEGVQAGKKSLSGLIGDEAFQLKKYAESGSALGGRTTTLAAARAMGVGTVSVSMGKIVAAPTAGSCGILPAVLLTAAEQTGAGEDRIIGGLFTAAGIGRIIDDTVSTSGASAGCQAECGAASCMAAAAAVEIAGGTPAQAAHAGAIALKSILGLVCDPVAGLVEIPCIKRNAMGAANALLAADMAMAGIESRIPIDEVIGAMKEIGDLMPGSLRETAQAGLANTPTARAIERQIFGTE